MTQLALLLALSLIGLALSLGFGRLEVKRSPGIGTVQRVEGAMDRASVALLRLGVRRALVLLAVPALGLAGFAIWSGERASVSALGRAAFAVCALLMGAATAAVQARLVLGLGTRAAGSAASFVARGSARALRPLLRGAVATAIFGETLGMLGAAAAFASLYAVRGGFASASGDPALALEVTRLLPAFALGAAVTALALAREGSIAATAASLGAAASSDPSFDAGDPRDPALLALLVGHQAGELLPRALGAYACGVTATVATALLAGAGGAGLALSGFVLMLLVRAFGWVGSLAGVFAARATDEEHPGRAVFRGQVCAALVTTFGLGASLFWLQRPQLLALMAAGMAGLLGVTLPALLGSLPFGRSNTTARELSDGKSGAAVTLARGAAVGLVSLGPALVWPALMLALALTTLSAHVPAGLVFGAFAAGALALSPLGLALSGFGILVPHARSLAGLARLDLDAPRRPARLDDASGAANIAGFTQAGLAVFVSLALGLMALVGSGSFTAGSFACAAALGLLGVTLLLLLAARTTRAAALGAKLVSSEVDRQLPRGAAGVATADSTPSYRACVDAALTAARGASPLELGVLLAVPFAVAALLRSVAGLSPALLGLGAAASLGGLLAALGGRATRSALLELRRRLRGNEAGLAPNAAVQAAAFGDLVGVTAASSIEAFALVLALTVLSLLPLLP